METLVKEKMQRFTISMEPTDWAVVFQVAKDMGVASRSAGVRYIIRDWLRLKKAAHTPHPPTQPQPIPNP